METRLNPSLTEKILKDLNVSNQFGSNFSTTVNLAGTLTTTGFFLVGNGGTLNVPSGSVVDIRLASGVANNGTINETGTGFVRRNATGVGFTDAAGVGAAFVPAGTPLFVTLFDLDENTTNSLVDTSQVTISSPVTGDTETLVLTVTSRAAMRRAGLCVTLMLVEMPSWSISTRSSAFGLPRCCRCRRRLD